MHFFTKYKVDILYIVLLLLAAFILTSDLFLKNGQPATFDGTIHITTIAQFYTSLSQGQFPVTWADGFANYGMPLPIISHQTTNYLGAILQFFTKDIVLSTNIVYLLGAFLSSIFFYIFLRHYFNSSLAVIGTLFFNFSTYRIINIYIRGALPEFFAITFFPIALLGIHYIFKNKIILGSGLLSLGVAMICFTNPLMFIVSLSILLPYALFMSLTEKFQKKYIVIALFSILLGLGMSSGYLIPLVLESKYFYYGLGNDHLMQNQFLQLQNYFDPSWYYYYKNDIFVRGNFIKFGILESLVVCIGLLLSAFYIVKKKTKNQNLLFFTSIISILLVILMSPLSEWLFLHLPFLNGIQFPWRFFGAFILFPPIILCVLLSKMPNQNIFIVLFLLLIAIIQFPQIYGKNFTHQPQKAYFFTTKNLHGDVMNTVWTGKTDEYPVRNRKYDVIQGEGNVTHAMVHNGFRNYTIEAKTPIRMVDYTFYFPGWNVYIDKQKTAIQYQDPAYRGVITYDVPSGKHSILLQFEPTKMRKVGYVIASFSLLLFLVMLLKILNNLKKK